LADAFERADVEFNEFKKSNPDITFSKFYMERVLRNIKQGDAHATLGKKLKSGKDFWEAGATQFETYIKRYEVLPGHKLVDYGCGSLRIGAHFVRYLMPEHYFGLDVISGFYEIGKESIGEELLKEKAPRFGAISPTSVDEATKFGADIVFSSAVSHHIHPDETDTYYGNVKKLASKPGCRLIFETAVSAGEGFRFEHRSWARPKEFFLAALKGLRFVKFHKSADRTHEGPNGPLTYTIGAFEFRRV
jgi:hypothetical protein